MDLGGSGQKIRARDGRWGERGPNDLEMGDIWSLCVILQIGEVGWAVGGVVWSVEGWEVLLP